MLSLLALTMDPILKHKGVLFNMKYFYSNMCIIENDNFVLKEKDVRDSLGKIYRAHDQRYGHDVIHLLRVHQVRVFNLSSQCEIKNKRP